MQLSIAVVFATRAFINPEVSKAHQTFSVMPQDS